MGRNGKYLTTVTSPNKLGRETYQVGDIPIESAARKTPKGANWLILNPGVHRPSKTEKHKKRKCHTLETNKLIKENLLKQLENDGFSSGLGPSISKISSTVLLASMNSWRTRAKSGSRKRDNARKCSGKGLADGESVERNSPRGALLAVAQQRQKKSISVSEVNRRDAREPEFTDNCKRYASQNGMISLTHSDNCHQKYD